MDHIRTDGWTAVDLSTATYITPPLPKDRVFLSWKNCQQKSLLALFLQFVNKPLLQLVIDGLPEGDKYLSCGTRSGSKPKYKPDTTFLYKVLACQIRIMGLQNTKVNLREAVEEAMNHFKTKYACTEHPYITKVLHGFATTLFDQSCSDMLSKNFQGMALEVGQATAGDEKLFYYSESQILRN